MNEQHRVPTISQYEPADFEGVCKVIAEVWKEYGSTDTPETVPDLQSIPDTYQNERGGFWVAKVDGRVVGTVAVKQADAHLWMLKRMYVLAPFRGKASGIGNKLLTCVIDAVRGWGGGAIYLGTPDFLKRAHRFCEKHGFSSVPRASLPPLITVDPIDSLFYSLAITAPLECAHS